MFLTKEEMEVMQKFNLNAQSQMTYAYLKEFCFGTKNVCFPSLETLSDKLKCSTRTVTRNINKLVDCGIVKRIKRGKMKTNVYVLVIKNSCESASRLKRNNKAKNVNNGNKVTRHDNTQNYTKYIVNDDYTLVQPVINELTLTYGQDIIGQALLRIKGKSISINGFRTYLEKAINTIIQYLKQTKKYEAVKKSFEYIKEHNFINKKKKKSTFNNFEQREYDYNALESVLRGETSIPEGMSINEYMESVTKGIIRSEQQQCVQGFNNFTPREYNFVELEKGLLGWE